MSNLICIICTENPQYFDHIQGTPCGHAFHAHCLQRWIERSKTCPQCRTKLSDENIFRLYLNFDLFANTLEQQRLVEKEFAMRESIKQMMCQKASMQRSYQKAVNKLKEQNAILEQRLKLSELKQFDRKNLLRITQSNLQRELKRNRQLEKDCKQLREEKISLTRLLSKPSKSTVDSDRFGFKRYSSVHFITRKNDAAL